VESIYHPEEANEFRAKHPDIPPELALRVYTSRLIGREPSLVLHGGGNTSVKFRIKNVVGEEQEVLYVKGSGVDLAIIEPAGFVGLDLEPLRKLCRLSALPDEEMENQLKVHKIRFSSPDPSVEALLHAFLPSRYIDHTHADFILALSNQKNGEALLKDALQGKVAILPYLTPGLTLARGALARFEQDPEVEAMVVAHHGIFTFGEDAQTSYERMIRYVGRAEAYVKEKMRSRDFGVPREDLPSPRDLPGATARLNQGVRGACAFKDKGGHLRRFYAR
jgi:rhamnose utilization protein RhaD (predicted bifunctional aldolase and dehydrogenase)